MSTATSTAFYRELQSITFYGKTFQLFPDTNSQDRSVRNLELRLSQEEIDEDSDPIDILTRPLRVLLIEEMPSNDGKTEGYEDVYYFTHDGDFIRHGWRKFKRDNGRREYSSEKYSLDGDLQKLFQRGESIREILFKKRLHESLENHPTVNHLKKHTLWSVYNKS